MSESEKPARPRVRRRRRPTWSTPGREPAWSAEPGPPPDPDAQTRRAQAQAEAAWLSGGGAGDPHAGRHRRIAEAAYFRAERRGFAPGGALDDWLKAEREVEAALGLGR